MGSLPVTLNNPSSPPLSPNEGENLEGNLIFGTNVKLQSAQASTLNSRKHASNVPRENGGGKIAASLSNEAYEDEYNEFEIDPRTVLQGSSGGGLQTEPTLDIPQKMNLNTQFESMDGTDSLEDLFCSARGQIQVPIKLQKTNEKGRYIFKTDDPELRDVLRKGLQRVAETKGVKKRTQFSDLVFTRQFTAFDRQNTERSPFRGFYTLFWLGTFLMLVKIAARNWQVYGSVFGRNEILTMMFHRDVLVLGLTDVFLCVSTVFCLLLQKTILAGYLSWNKQGWIIQNIWQTLYLAATISWTIHRDWPWSHTVFIVLHCLVMLMKQHSYAFYNGYLSDALRQKKSLEIKLNQLKEFDPASRPTSPSVSTALATSYLDQDDMDTIHRRRLSVHSRNTAQLERQNSDLADVAAAIESEKPLDTEQIHCFKRIIKTEIEALDEELHGKCSSGSINFYPLNLNIRDFAGYIPLPTVVYELEYPRQEQINWSYVAEKTAATFGVLCVMIVVSQAYIYPAVVTCLKMKENGMPLQQRLQEFPWVLSDLLFPFMMEYLLAWYVIWECILNVLAELTLFADRGFYADWWNSTSWDQFSRDWNRPVHAFLLRHVYHSSISAFRISRSSATLFTFFLSACVHELVMWCIFKKLRGYLMVMQMMQLPLVGASRRWLRGQDVLGNLIFWLGIFTGPSFLCSLYLII